MRRSTKRWHFANNKYRQQFHVCFVFQHVQLLWCLGHDFYPPFTSHIRTSALHAAAIHIQWYPPPPPPPPHCSPAFEIYHFFYTDFLCKKSSIIKFYGLLDAFFKSFWHLEVDKMTRGGVFSDCLPFLLVWNTAPHKKTLLTYYERNNTKKSLTFLVSVWHCIWHENSICMILLYLPKPLVSTGGGRVQHCLQREDEESLSLVMYSGTPVTQPTMGPMSEVVLRGWSRQWSWKSGGEFPAKKLSTVVVSLACAMHEVMHEALFIICVKL
jgi:hypothetical protein